MKGPKIGLFACLVALLGVLSKPVLAACDPTLAPTYTPNAGLAKPQINSCSWGLNLNNDWGIVDSSFAILNATNTFSKLVTFSTLAVTNQITAADGTVMMAQFANNGSFFSGYGAGINLNTSPNSDNTGIGYTALATCTGCAQNTALGQTALAGISGSNNVVVGAGGILNGAGFVNNNTCVGAAQFSNSGSGANDNTTIGYNAFNVGKSAVRNTVIGSTAMASATTASSNTVIGYGSGTGPDLSSAVVTGAGNTFIGYEAGTSTSAIINKSIALGYGSVVSSSNTAQIGGINGSGAEVLMQVSSITTNQITVSSLTNVQAPFVVTDPASGSGNQGFVINEKVAGSYLPNYQFQQNGALRAWMGYSNNGVTGITWGGSSLNSNPPILSLDVGGTNNLKLWSGGFLASTGTFGLGTFAPTVIVSSQSLIQNSAGATYLAAVDSTSRTETFIGVTNGNSVIGTSTNTWILPTVDGSVGQVLATNGAQTLSWSTGVYVSSGGANNGTVSSNSYIRTSVRTSSITTGANDTVFIIGTVSTQLLQTANPNEYFFTLYRDAPASNGAAIAAGTNVAADSRGFIAAYQSANGGADTAEVGSVTPIATDTPGAGTHSYIIGFRCSSAPCNQNQSGNLNSVVAFVIH